MLYLKTLIDSSGSILWIFLFNLALLVFAKECYQLQSRRRDANAWGRKKYLENQPFYACGAKYDKRVRKYTRYGKVETNHYIHPLAFSFLARKTLKLLKIQ